LEELILAVETSCDETAASIVDMNYKIRSNIVASQVEWHEKFGGVVPEIASRKHVELIDSTVKEAVDEAGISFKDISYLAVTVGPGLIGALLVGVAFTQALGYSLSLPVVGVNHVLAHVWAVFLENSLDFPFIALVVSGGHTSLLEIKGEGKLNLLGKTLDDAAGEAFDKVAKFLGLPYPGGPVIDKLAQEGDAKAISFPRAMLEEGYNFSFSGLKTAVINYVKREGRERIDIPDLLASFEEAVVDVLVSKSLKALRKKKVKKLVVSGGVAANSRLRERLKEVSSEEGIEVFLPSTALCTDNAAMVGAAAIPRIKAGIFLDISSSPHPNLPLSY
jgi:N6-L-threonylcarbamoyladenine synthase